MRLVTTNVRSRDWNAVRSALACIGVHDIDVTEVQVLAANHGRECLHAGAEYIVDRVPQSRIEIAVPASLVERVIAAINACAAGSTSHHLANQAFSIPRVTPCSVLQRF